MVRQWVGWRRSGGRSAIGEHSEVVAAVDRVLEGQSPDCSVTGVTRGWVQAQGRELLVQDVVLPAGVFGRWLSLPDRDVVQVGVGVVGRDRTIAHELGHMVLGHRGLPVTEYVEGIVQAASSDLISHMLQRACCADSQQPDVWQRDELAAEWFAGLLTRRVEEAQQGGSAWGCNLDDVLG
ncbi:hypothetical protein [Mycobacteroides abscessus]|uniref:hypothetical protein n=1 Tax=Mycobacteroides abscessus TaxID=36809 RepID=UPI000B1DB9A9|nr:hypothetical protein [Mycobacteroides abscessus]